MKLREWFWMAVALFAYRRWVKVAKFERGKLPDGIPGMRDPDSRCPIYSPRPRVPGDFGDCEGDGHYLCQECCHLIKDKHDDG